MRERNLPEKIADLLIAQIYTHELKPGDRLIPERQLADTLGVDRTSLRMALRQLIRMNLLEARQGSGIRVLDINSQAGLDFLQAIFDIPELQIGADSLEKAIGFWCLLSPELMQVSLQNMSPEDVSNIRQLIIQQQQANLRGEPRETLVDMEIMLQDAIIEKNKNELIRLLANSVRSLRKRLIVDLFSVVNIGEHLQFQLEMIQKLGAQSYNVDEIVSSYRKYVEEKLPQLMSHFSVRNAQPKILRSPISGQIYEPMLLSVTPRLKIV